MQKLSRNSSGYIIVSGDSHSASFNSALIAIPASAHCESSETSSTADHQYDHMYTLPTASTNPVLSSAVGDYAAASAPLLTRLSSSASNTFTGLSSQFRIFQLPDQAGAQFASPAGSSTTFSIGTLPGCPSSSALTNNIPPATAEPGEVFPDSNGCVLNRREEFTIGMIDVLNGLMPVASPTFVGSDVTQNMTLTGLTRESFSNVPLRLVSLADDRMGWKSTPTVYSTNDVIGCGDAPGLLRSNYGIQIDGRSQLIRTAGTSQQTHSVQRVPVVQGSSSDIPSSTVHHPQAAHATPSAQLSQKSARVSPVKLAMQTNGSTVRTKSIAPSLFQVQVPRSQGAHTTQRSILPAAPRPQMNYEFAAGVFKPISANMSSIQRGSTVHHGFNGTLSGVSVRAPVVSQMGVGYAPVQAAAAAHALTTVTRVDQTLRVCQASNDSQESRTASHNIAPRQLQYLMENSGPKQRKPCNCTKSQCLKLYCECFANGEFCSDCNCINCFNNLEHEVARSKAVKTCIVRNPHAFHPKIGKGDKSRQHAKGCNCKRSGCLKNYCECYEAKISCSHLCRCVGCRNVEEGSSQRATLLQLADAAESRTRQQSAAAPRLSSHTPLPPPTRPPLPPVGAERPAYTFVTLEVVEAMCSCLVAELEEGEGAWSSDAELERRVLEEFGRCVTHVIDTATRTRAPSPPMRAAGFIGSWQKMLSNLDPC